MGVAAGTSLVLLACTSIACGGRVTSRDGENTGGAPDLDAVGGACEREDANGVAIFVMPVDAATCAARPVACDPGAPLDDSSLRAEIEACAPAAVSCLACEYVQLATDASGCVTGISASHAYGEPPYVTCRPGARRSSRACERRSRESDGPASREPSTT
jgi:hypothetical protein